MPKIKEIESSKDGMSEYEANQLFDVIEGFAGYAFNKSHSVAYAEISYQMMWLKTHYPVEFYAGALSVTDEEKLQPLVEDAADSGISVAPPDINKSGYNFAVDTDTRLLTPFNRLKGLSDKTAEAILEAREAGPFTSYEDFDSRVARRRCNKTHRDTLDKVGAFASIDPTQLPSLDMTRRKDQMLLMPGLQAEPLPATRDLNIGRAALIKLEALTNEYMDAEDETIEINVGKQARIMLVADCPNWGEEKQGQFLKGNATSDLAAALRANNLTRAHVYGTGLLKRTKNEKIINAKEIETFAPYLEREIEITKPPVIVTLGSAATKYLVPKIKGSVMDVIGRVYYDEKRDAVIIVGFNPTMIYHDPTKLDVLIEVIGKAKRLARIK